MKKYFYQLGIILFCTLMTNAVFSNELDNIMQNLTDTESKEIKRKKLLNDATKIFNNQRLKSLSLNPGFRNIKPGMLSFEVQKEAGKSCLLNLETPSVCYDLDNLKFYGTYKNSQFIQVGDNHLGYESKYFNLMDLLIIDIGPIVNENFLYDLTISNDTETGNIYSKMRTNLDNKYKIEYYFSDRDRQLFNKDEKEDLLVTYENGQVALRVKRIKKGYKDDLRLYVEYRDIEKGKNFLDENKPKKASGSDF